MMYLLHNDPQKLASYMEGGEFERHQAALGMQLPVGAVLSLDNLCPKDHRGSCWNPQHRV